MKAVYAWAAVAIGFLCGCDTINERHFCVAGGDSAVQTRQRVGVVLATVATRVHLTEMTARSKAPDTVAFYTLAFERPAPEDFFRVSLGARGVGNDIAVDLQSPFGPAPREFEAAEALLASELDQSFGASARNGRCTQ